MDEIPRTSSQSPGLDAGAWIGRVVIAVLLAEAILGIHCFRHQRPDSAIVGENYGRRRPVAYVPWQRRLECPGFVYCGAGTLLCWHCGRNAEIRF